MPITDVCPSPLQLDLWYVILNGAVEISRVDGRTETLCMGNSFGISPTLDKQYMNGEVRTKGDDCQVTTPPEPPPRTFCLLLLHRCIQNFL